MIAIIKGLETLWFSAPNHFMDILNKLLLMFFKKVVIGPDISKLSPSLYVKPHSTLVV